MNQDNITSILFMKLVSISNIVEGDGGEIIVEKKFYNGPDVLMQNTQPVVTKNGGKCGRTEYCFEVLFPIVREDYSPDDYTEETEPDQYLLARAYKPLPSPTIQAP